MEVILVNAKGGGHTPVAEHCGRFPLRLVNNGGAPLHRSRAANIGLAACRGIYIGFLDDDDSVDPDHLQHLVNALRTSSPYGLAYAGVRGVGGNLHLLENIAEFRAPEVTFTKLLLGNLMPIHAVLFSGNLLEQGAAFDEALDLYEDWDFWLQLTRQTTPLFVNHTTATYYADGASAVGLGSGVDPALQQQAKERLVVKWLPLLTSLEFIAVGGLYHQIVSQLASASAALADKDRQLADKDRHISSLYASHSWYITAPLRWAGHRVKRILPSLGQIALLCDRCGGAG